MEKKVLLISKYKALLTHASIALISFLFPLCWKHVLIPILPKNMTDVLDAPVPFLIGIDPQPDRCIDDLQQYEADDSRPGGSGKDAGQLHAESTADGYRIA